MPKKDKSTFSHFFKEDAEVVQDIFNGQADQEPTMTVGAPQKEVFPKIMNSEKATEDEFNAYWLKLRAFFRTANNVDGLASDLSPVMMAPLYTQSTVGADFPVWVAGIQVSDDAGLCLSLRELLKNKLNETAPEEGDAEILKKNIERVIHLANSQFADAKPRTFLPAINAALDTLTEELEVKGEEGKAFSKDINDLLKALPAGGNLLPYSPRTSFQLLESAAVSSHTLTRSALIDEINDLKNKLNDLLRVEADKNPDQHPSEGHSVTTDFMDSIVNFQEISTLAPEPGTESLGQDRLNRIKDVVSTLEQSPIIIDQQGYVFIEESMYSERDLNWESTLNTSTKVKYDRGEGVSLIRASFEKNIADWTKLYVAKRIAQLELNGEYLSAIHDDYFRHFNWKNFSADELNNCPHFILVSDESVLFESELSELSSLLTDNIPVKIVSVRRDHADDHNQSGSTDGAIALHAQSGLSALMLSHKNIYVAQSSSITPQKLFDVFAEGLNAFAPAFFSILIVDDEEHNNPYVWTSAAIESRDFPGFTFKGLLGTPWGSRFDIQNNPQSHAKWPTHTLTVVNEEDEKSEMDFEFTYAHKAALSSLYHSNFMQVGQAYWDDNLISLLEFNGNSVEENIGKIPFIWMLDGKNTLCKVAVSWPMVMATQERLDYWRFLQENSGINNYHVTQAVEVSESALKTSHAKELATLKAEHLADIERVREEEAGLVMENLTSVLLNLDTSHITTTSSAPVKPVVKADTAVSTAEAAAEESSEAEDDDVLSNDPYIDTVLCTSCNECTEMNGVMFNYNKDKMAFIADPKGGTFLELVKAAELCPVGIIHPGSPLNPSEPNLDELMLRAEKFN
jgi:ferredoxin